MTQSHLADTIRELAAPLAAGLGLDIWGIELAFGGRSLVRIYVERQAAACLPPEFEGDPPGTPFAQQRGVEQDASEPDGGEQSASEPGVNEQGVSIEQCAELSRLLGLSLEVEDIIPGAYILEVSSPGLDRTFFTEAQLAAALGRLVEIQFAHPLPDMPERRKFRGVIAEVPAIPGKGERFTINAEDCPKPEMETAVSFVFGDVKKAKQVWLAPEKNLPGKAAGKGKAKKPSRKADRERPGPDKAGPDER